MGPGSGPVEVLDADHTALLGAVEIGAGLLLLLVGLTGSRIPVALLGLAMALGATAMAIEPDELQREAGHRAVVGVDAGCRRRGADPRRAPGVVRHKTVVDVS